MATLTQSDSCDRSYFDPHKERRPSLAAIIAGQVRDAADCGDQLGGAAADAEERDAGDDGPSGEGQGATEYRDFDFTDPAFLVKHNSRSNLLL